jgi:hypothetical protein
VIIYSFIFSTIKFFVDSVLMCKVDHIFRFCSSFILMEICEKIDTVSLY